MWVLAGMAGKTLDGVMGHLLKPAGAQAKLALLGPFCSRRLR
jgi:hypothetical protein